MPVAGSMPPAFAAELDRRVRRIVWCTMATIDGRGRPRTRRAGNGSRRPAGAA
jgi:hypothetical protein